MNTNLKGATTLFLKQGMVKNLCKIVLGPLLLFFSIIGIHYCYIKVGSLFAVSPYWKPKFDIIEPYLYWLSLTLCAYWFLIRVLNKLIHILSHSILLKTHSSLQIVFPFFTSLTKIIFFLAFLNQLVQYAGVPEGWSYCLIKMNSILIICTVTWVLLKVVDVAGQLLLHYYTANNKDTIATRKINTQTLILQRVAISLIIILAAGSILMLFDTVRALGASVLTTAGIAGLVITFTAQRSLASIFSGLEIALTQPIKIGDSIVIDNEFGTVEEINFRSVVIKLWDWRRLIVPTTHFLEKPFQNWSRQPHDNLIGTVFLYVDFTLSVPQLRSKLEAILASSPFWDGKVGKIQVSDLQERVMQLKILASAKNAEDVSSLRSEIREKIITYIVKNHPEALPTARSLPVKPKALNLSERI